MLRVIFLLGICLQAIPLFADSKSTCVYLLEDGKLKQADSLNRVPQRYRATARCASAANEAYMASPDEVSLKGSVRHENMNSMVGRIELRWPRKVELLFGRTPQRAVVEAAGAVSRALKSVGFPPNVQTLSLDWKLVFMDEDLPETQIPAYLVSNCHPGWMTPPSNVYIVAQRVAAGCGGEKPSSTSVADSQLAQVLIHEMGHAVEYQLLKTNLADDRMRAEGFASWFEQYASDFSTVIKKGTARNFYYALARASFKDSPDAFSFTGSAYDYARASMFFNAIVEKRGVPGLLSVYRVMTESHLDFLTAVEKSTGWSESRMASEIGKLLQ